MTTDEKTALQLELEQIARKRGGLTPAAVVQSASAKSSPLHKHFCWEDTEAARRYREIQAAHLIRTVKVEITTSPTKTVTVRAFVNVRNPDEDGCVNLGERGLYMPITKVIDDESMRTQMLDAAKRELKSFRIKYALLSELAKIFGAIDELDQ